MYKNRERFVKGPVPFQGSEFIMFFLISFLSGIILPPYANYQDEPSLS